MNKKVIQGTKSKTTVKNKLIFTTLALLLSVGIFENKINADPLRSDNLPAPEIESFQKESTASDYIGLVIILTMISGLAFFTLSTLMKAADAEAEREDAELNARLFVDVVKATSEGLSKKMGIDTESTEK